MYGVVVYYWRMPFCLGCWKQSNDSSVNNCRAEGGRAEGGESGDDAKASLFRAISASLFECASDPCEHITEVLDMEVLQMQVCEASPCVLMETAIVIRNIDQCSWNQCQRRFRAISGFSACLCAP